MKTVARIKNVIFGILLSAFCFFSAIALFFQTELAFAKPDYTPKVTVESKTVHRGQTFELTVDLSENQGLTALYLTLDYDVRVMKLTGLKTGAALNSLALTTDNTAELGYGITPFNMSWTGETPDASNGNIAVLVFQSFSDAEVGEYAVSLTYDKSNTRSDYNEPIDVNIKDGLVNIIEGKYKVYYRDWDGKTLYQKEYNEGEPSYEGETPTRETDDEYSYSFNGWKGVVSDNPSEVIFEADYEKTARIYTLFYYVDGYGGDTDGIFDETDYFTSVELAFGSEIAEIFPEEKPHHKFVGWYKNENFTESFLYGTMPSHNTRLYGYYKFDVRDKDVPKISLETTDSGDDYAIVDVFMISNSGFASIVLTLDYDTAALTLTEFTRQETFSTTRFSTTNREKIAEKGFKFYFSSDTDNNTETGLFLTLKFAIKNSAEKGVYDVTFTYDYKTDATYYVGNGETKYTMLEIVNAEVPIGKINHWADTVGKNNEIDIDIVSKDYKPINVKMFVELVTDSVEVDENHISSSVGDRYLVSSAYTIKLLQNGEEIQPNTILTVKIKLNAKEKKSKNLKLFYLRDDGTLEEYSYERDGENLIFTTNHLSEWLIFSDYNVGGIENYVILIILPTLLAIATMGYALIVIGKNRKRRLINE